MPLFQQFVSKAIFAALQVNHTCVKGFILFCNPITQIVMSHENNHSTLQSCMQSLFLCPNRTDLLNTSGDYVIDNDLLAMPVAYLLTLT